MYLYKHLRYMEIMSVPINYYSHVSMTFLRNLIITI